MLVRNVAPILALAFLAGCGAPKQDPADLAALRKEALARGDSEGASRHTLALNRVTELLAAQTPDERERIERKYDILRGVFAATPREFYARIIPIAYHPLELTATKDVLRTYGDLYVAETAGEELKLDTMPWAGYWYPLAGTHLFGTDTAPLAKLDRLAAATGGPGGTVAWERTNHDAFPAAAWEGFCSAWATASTRTVEPQRPLEYKGIRFETSDIKALLTKAHERFPMRQLGVRYNGDAETDGTYQDLRPEAFHRLAAAFLGEKRQALVFDDDPGVAVWSKPLYRLRWTIAQDPAIAAAYLVKAYPWFIKHRNGVDEAVTGDTDIVSPAFEYRLYVDRDVVVNGKFLVIAGEWLGRSLNQHPDYALVPEDGGAWGTGNPALAANFGVVRELLARGTPR